MKHKYKIGDLVNVIGSCFALKVLNVFLRENEIMYELTRKVHKGLLVDYDPNDKEALLYKESEIQSLKEMLESYKQ